MSTNRITARQINNVDVNSDVGVSVDINVDTLQEARAACFQL